MMASAISSIVISDEFRLPCNVASCARITRAAILGAAGGKQPPSLGETRAAASCRELVVQSYLTSAVGAAAGGQHEDHTAFEDCEPHKPDDSVASRQRKG
jgi:hypothetical protein